MKVFACIITYISCLTMVFGAPARGQTWQSDGDVKVRGVNTAYPSNSLVHTFAGDNVTDLSLTARFNFSFELNQWSGEASYQIVALDGDTLDYLGDSQNGFFQTPRLPNDDRRLIDLSDIIHDADRRALIHRLDRLNIGYQGTSNVVKLGRQAVSWGNGLIYTPMDFFNPFDPSAVDTEYKPGEDMIYAQHLFSNGDDLQFVWVARRDEQKNSTHDVNSTAVKYHGFIGANEFDLLLAKHYQDTIVGIGTAISVGGSVIRGDWVVSDTDRGKFNNVVANVSYSWIGWGKNMTGSLEYFHNGFGISGRLGVSELLGAPDLISRLNRGELFTLGRDYLAGSAVVEMAPLWQLNPNVFYNLSDQSSLVQLISQHDLSQNIQLVGALSVPLGSPGTEYGGFVLDESGSEEAFSQSDWSLFAQLAWYF
jgi:hypothetical protein